MPAMGRVDRAIGLARSLAIYHGIPVRQRRLRALYATFVGPGDLGDPPLGNADPEKAPPQDPGSLVGKTLRLRDDGTVPPDNPFVGRPGYRPEIFTMGHRNMLGLTLNPMTGEMWEIENGPNGGDDVNVLQPGKNYGWP